MCVSSQVVRMRHFGFAVCFDKWAEGIQPDRNFNHAVSIVISFNVSGDARHDSDECFVSGGVFQLVSCEGFGFH